MTVGSLRTTVARTANSSWVRGLAGTAGTRLVVLFVGLSSTVALARGLGPEGRGVYALAMTLATLGVVAMNLGYNTANTYFASRDPGTIPALVANSVAQAVAIGLGGAGLLGLAWLLGVRIDPLAYGTAWLVVCWIPVGVAFIQLQPLLLAVGRVRQFNIAEAGWQLTAVALVLGLWATDRLTPTSAFVVTLGALVGGLAVVGVYLRPAARPRAAPSAALFRRAMPYAARTYATTLSGVALIRLDVLVVENRLGTRQVGLYAVAVTIGEALQILPTTIGALLLPKLAKLVDEEQRWAMTRRVMAATALLMAVICGLTAVVAAPAIRLLFGPAYRPSTTPLYWLLPGIVLIGVNAVLIHYFLAVGMPPSVVIGQAAAVVLNIVAAIVLTPPLGLAGAGIASTLAYGASLAMTAWCATRWRRKQRARAQGGLST